MLHTQKLLVVPYKKKLSLLQYRLEWLSNINNVTTVGRMLKMATLGVVNITFFALSFLRISPKLKKLLTSQKLESDFRHSIKDKQPPDVNEIINLPSKTRAFTHITEYAIQDDVIWHRPRSSTEKWQPLIFDEEKGRKPKAIDADGANLIVIDEAGYIHYKKVLKEYRVNEINHEKNRHLVDYKEKINELDKTSYVAVDKSGLNNWKKEWFSLPIASPIVNFFAGKRLKLESNEKSCVISHRGRYNDYIEDAVGQKHPVSAGVTTLYVLSNNGRKIRKFDPWSPKHAKVHLYFPETTSTVFTALNISASASTIMAIGYEINVDTHKKSLRVISKLGDIDTEGWNPALKYSYTQNYNDANVRVLPIGMTLDGKEWTEHPLPEGAKITNSMTIQQTGKGNNARELKIEGKNKENEWGYFVKNIADQAWEFIPLHKTGGYTQCLPSGEDLIDQNNETSTVHNYKGNNDNNTYSVALESFGKHAYHSKIILAHNNIHYTLTLYKKHGLASFLGKKTYSYEIALPKAMLTDKFILDTFSHKDREKGAAKITVQQNKETLTISGAGFKWKVSSTNELRHSYTAATLKR